MRKIIRYSILLLVMVIYSNLVKSAFHSPDVLPGEPGEWMIVSFSFGNLNKNCDGFGICILYTYVERSGESSALNREADATGYVYFDYSGVFTVEFIKDQMSEEIRRTHFNSKFKMDGSFEIPNHVMMGLNHMDKYTISPGRYSVEDSNGRLKVKFSQ